MLLFSQIISGSLAPLGSLYPAVLYSHPYGRVPAVAELSISTCTIQTETPKGRSSFLFLWLKVLAPPLEELNSFLVQLLIYMSGTVQFLAVLAENALCCTNLSIHQPLTWNK